MRDGQGAGHPALLLAAGLAIGLGLNALPTGGPLAVTLAAVLAGTLLVTVPVPGGGSVPLGYAMAMAVPALLGPAEAATVVAAGSLLAAIATWALEGVRPGVATAGRLLLSTLTPVGAVAALLTFTAGAEPIERVIVAAAVLVFMETSLVRLARVGGHIVDLRSAALVYATLASGGVLLAVATTEVGVALAVMASTPLLIARFSFQRYAAATDTLAQTVQALGLVPELAALAPLGHSERSAVYAAAIADELGFERMARTRVVSAARLHHLGAVPFDPGDPDQQSDPPGVDEIARQGATILRQAGFPAPVANLIESARAGSLDGTAPGIEAAVVRVATAFDEVVGDDAAAIGPALSILGGSARDPHTRRALAALLHLADRPAVIEDAIAAGDRFRDAAADLDLDALMAVNSGAEILPFARRRA